MGETMVKGCFGNETYKISIRERIVVSFVIIIIIMGTLNLTTILKSKSYSNEYDKIVSEIAMMNSLNDYTKTNIDLTMGQIVAGVIKFEDGNQYKVIKNAKDKINHLLKGAVYTEKAGQLEVALRTLDTLTTYVDKLRIQIKEKSTVSSNQEILEDIRGVTSLLEDVIKEFILYELKTCEQLNNKMQKSFNIWVTTCIIVLIAVVVFSIMAIWFISGSISKPINELCNTTVDIANGNFDIKIEYKKHNEIAVLGESINIMAVKVKELLKRSIEEQENIKKSELKVLQAQINPHFLYNTLDTIVWTAEAKKNSQVIEIVKALSSFFRIALSDGKELITIKEEISHVESYLTIQKIRYRDILNFDVKVDDEILEYSILKLTLQPLVENALYHGIKNRRAGGFINVIGSMKDDKTIIFEITDNGIGIKKDKLEKMMEKINCDNNETTTCKTKDCGFGLKNIQKRIQLYYGKEYGISILSEYNFGTKAILIIPIEE